MANGRLFAGTVLGEGDVLNLRTLLQQLVTLLDYTKKFAPFSGGLGRFLGWTV